MMLCLEFQEYFSHDFCPLVLGTLLISEVTGIGLTFFSPLLSCFLCAVRTSGCLCWMQKGSYRCCISPPCFSSPARPRSCPCRAGLGAEHHASQCWWCWWCSAPCTGGQYLCTWRAVVFCCVWSPGIAASSSTRCCRSAPRSRAALPPVPLSLQCCQC